VNAPGLPVGLFIRLWETFVNRDGRPRKLHVYRRRPFEKKDGMKSFIAS